MDMNKQKQTGVCTPICSSRMIQLFTWSTSDSESVNTLVRLRLKTNLMFLNVQFY